MLWTLLSNADNSSGVINIRITQGAIKEDFSTHKGWDVYCKRNPYIWVLVSMRIFCRTLKKMDLLENIMTMLKLQAIWTVGNIF